MYESRVLLTLQVLHMKYNTLILLDYQLYVSLCFCELTKAQENTMQSSERSNSRIK